MTTYHEVPAAMHDPATHRLQSMPAMRRRVPAFRCGTIAVVGAFRLRLHMAAACRHRVIAAGPCLQTTLAKKRGQKLLKCESKRTIKCVYDWIKYCVVKTVISVSCVRPPALSICILSLDHQLHCRIRCVCLPFHHCMHLTRRHKSRKSLSWACCGIIVIVCRILGWMTGCLSVIDRAAYLQDVSVST